MYYVYVLKSLLDNKFYIGSTNDLKKRFMEHNSGKVISTAPRKPFELIYYEAYQNEDLARNRESQLKKRGNARTWLFKRISNSSDDL